MTNTPPEAPTIVVASRKKPKSKARLRKLAQTRELWASYGLQKPQKPRYSGLQGVLWYLTSKAVRMADFAKYGGLCVDGCGKRVLHWKEADCGHFQTSGRSATRFKLENLALQTRECNTKQRHGDARHYSFGSEIDRRHGNGTAQKLIEESEKIYKITDDYLKEQIKLRLNEIEIYTQKLAQYENIK